MPRSIGCPKAAFSDRKPLSGERSGWYTCSFPECAGLPPAADPVPRRALLRCSNAESHRGVVVDRRVSRDAGARNRRRGRTVPGRRSGRGCRPDHGSSRGSVPRGPGAAHRLRPGLPAGTTGRPFVSRGARDAICLHGRGDGQRHRLGRGGRGDGPAGNAGHLRSGGAPGRSRRARDRPDRPRPRGQVPVRLQPDP